LDFAKLGITSRNLEAYHEILARPNGVFLVTGPTGSGKTTTLYAALTSLNSPEKKILTVEDPIEYHLEGINQIQVQPSIGLTFAHVLRSILRQDPDIVMIGEIRDVETARIAIQAALTGHLVLSTLHTNDAPSAITRLLDMGIEDYLLTSTLIGVAAQRLVRTLCLQCREQEPTLPELIEQLGLRRYTEGSEIMLYRPVGCTACNGSGYFGRVGLVETLPVSDALRRLILQQAEAKELLRTAIKEGMQTMYDDGMRKALAGQTTVEEVLRVTRDV
jgi:general secretion pathway protein E